MPYPETSRGQGARGPATRRELWIVFAALLAACSGKSFEGLFSESELNVEAGGPKLPIDAGAFELSFEGGFAFGETPCGASSGSRRLELENVGKVPIVYQASVDDPKRFVIESGARGVVSQGSKTEIIVAAHPVAADAEPGERYSSNVVLTDSYGHLPLRVPITLEVVGGKLALGTDKIDFGEVGVGKEREQLLTFRNTGNADSSLSFAAGAGSDFEAQARQTSAGVTLRAGAEGSTTIRFRPSRSGPIDDTLNVYVAGSVCGSPVARVTLRGVGVAAAALDGGIDAEAGGAVDAASDAGARDAGNDAGRD